MFEESVIKTDSESCCILVWVIQFYSIANLARSQITVRRDNVASREKKVSRLMI